MPARNEHLVVIMLEPVEFNVEFEVWPQHITIVPWFPVDDEDRLDKLLSEIASRHKPFDVTVEGQEIWGRQDKFQVLTIADNEQLRLLHQDVFHGLEVSGFPIHQKDFLGDKYRPHISIRNETQKQQSHPSIGAQLKVGEFSLIGQTRLKKTGLMIKRVKKNYRLG